MSSLKGYTDYEDYKAIRSPPLGVDPFTLDADGKVEIHHALMKGKQASFQSRGALCNHVKRARGLSVSPSAHGAGKPPGAFVIQEKIWYSGIMNTHRQLAAQKLQGQQSSRGRLLADATAGGGGDNNLEASMKND